MRTRWLGLLAVLTGLSLACSLLTLPVTRPTATAPDDNTNATDNAARPADFGFTYQWAEGSLPPPYHYEYAITVAPDGSGRIVFSPDYPGDEVPEWTEPFSLTPDQMDEIYALMVEQGVFTTRWRQASDIPVGGPSDSLDVTADGQTVEIPAFPRSSQVDAAQAVYAAVNALVPPELMADLMQRRDDYMAEHGG